MAAVMAATNAEQHGASVATSVMVLDAVGEVFDRLRELDLPVALWRVLDPRRISPTLDLKLTVFASYGPADWDAIESLSSHAPTMIITTTYDRGEADEALRRQLVGYVDAALPEAALDRSLRGALARGEPAFPRDVIGEWLRLRREAVHAEHGAGDGLTHRQQEIIGLIAEGATDKEIAGTLGIATATAQKHVTNILQRLHVPNRAAAVAVVSRLRQSL